MTEEDRRKELSRLMLEQPNGLEVLMRRYQELTGMFPSSNLSPRQIIDAILECEANAGHHASASQASSDSKASGA